MRQIKFRAWDARERKMYTPGKGDTFFTKLFYDALGNLEEYEQGMNTIKHGSISTSGSYTYEPEKDNLLLQWTGLVDGEGKEIYEGDILDSKYERDHFELVVIKWNEECACFSASTIDGTSAISLTSIEWTRVVGNIYQNPELLVI